MKKVGFISLGCAKNRVNSEQMMFLLREAGYEVTGDTSCVDVVVVNTCSFIESAKTEAIDTILEVAEDKRAGNVGAIIVAGCLPQRYKDDILKELPEIDAIVGTGSFDEIVDVIGNMADKAHFGDIDAPVSKAGRIVSTSPVWAYLKIAEGCDNRCAYCCIPSIRGRYRSRPLEDIVDEAERLAEQGFKELNLVAQDTTAYGVDLYGRRSITKLLNALGRIEKLDWVRLLYMYPDGFDDALIDEIANNGTIVKYLDIPIQHIHDGILYAMNRRGTGRDIRELFGNLRERIPGVVLRTSIITGLPGEGGEEFEQLVRFLRETQIQRAGVFAYSPEGGTAAAKMERPDRETAEYRAEIVRGIQSEIYDDFNKKRIGTVQQVLIEGELDKDLCGRSSAEAPEVDGYIKIKAKGRIDPYAFANVKITGIEDGDPVGEVLQ